MALSDFLTEGSDIPAGSAIRSTVTQKVLPDWYTNYAMQLLANQAAVGQSPYTPYSAPRIAGFSPDQLAGFDATRAAAGAYKPGLDAATGTIDRAAGMSGVNAAMPYFGQAGAIDPSAAAAGDYGTARSLAGSAAGMSGALASQPFFGAAGSTISGALGTGGGLATAAPWLSKAGGDVTDVSRYMNPYRDDVINRIGELGKRNLMDVIMPGLEGRYIKAGQFQGSDQMTDTARAIRDTSSDILGKQAEFLNTGYTQAQAAMKGDLDRYGTLAGTAGQLGQNWMDALMKGGELQSSLGKSAADIAASDRSGALAASTQFGALGGAQAGLSAAQQKFLSDMGVNVANMTNTDASRLATLAGQQGNLGAAAQQLGMTGAGALGEIGKQQTTLNQSNLDTAYADFLKQQGYPQQQIDAMLGTYKGLPTEGLPAQSSIQGIEPSGVQPQYNPSTASSIASGLTGLGSFLSDPNNADLFRTIGSLF